MAGYLRPRWIRYGVTRRKHKGTDMQPINYDADGRIVVDAAGPIVSVANGLPFTAEGALAVSTGPAVVVQNGIPADADGRTAVSE